jgi:hypothetical protein
MMHLKRFGVLLLLMSLAVPVVQATPVAAELLLLVDVSGSINNSEFLLQRTGYANAFLDAAVQTLIADTPGGIAASLVYWSGAGQQSVAVGWTLLTDGSSADAFSTAIAAAGRPFNGNTAVQSALNYGGPLFANDFEGSRLIIDISGDGADNNSPGGLLPTGGRDNALGAGVTTINGLVIGGSAAVANYYTNNVIGGVNAQLFTASSFADFDRALVEKITFEVSEIPEPSVLLMLGSGLVGLSLLGRRFRR